MYPFGYRAPRRGLLPVLMLLGVGLLPCDPSEAAGATDDPEALLIVDCLLPGQVRQLGTRVRYLSRRRAAKLTATECAARGGEYAVAGGRAAALAVWLPAARDGDTLAQRYVGTLYERGLDHPPDYERAAFWYERAAQNGDVAAQLQLASLYESGLGVPLDADRARSWLALAAGPGAELVEDLDPLVEARRSRALGTALVALEERIATLERDNDSLSRALGEARSRLEHQTRRAVAASAENAEKDKRVAGERALRLRLESTVHELEADLEDRTRELEALRGELERARGALTEASAEVRRLLEVPAEEPEHGSGRGLPLPDLLARLEERQAAAEEARDELRRLQARMREFEDHARMLEAHSGPRAGDTTAMPPPEITLIDPSVPPTRGLVKTAPHPVVAARRIVGRVIAPAGLVSLTFGGRPVAPNEAGVFVLESGVRNGDEAASIVAVDALGRRSDLALRLAGPARRAESGQYSDATVRMDLGRFHALVIGNDAYRAPGLPRLRTARSDAQAVASLLTERYGFSVRTLLDATRYDILTALNEMRRELGEDDHFLLYYAGHGDLDRINMRGHWLPVDAERDSTANWISNVAITDLLNAMRVRHLLVVADSCYSGALTRSAIQPLGPQRASPEYANWVAEMLERRSRLALTSGGLQPVMDAGGGEHSVFARAFLEVLIENDGLLESRDLYELVAARVAYAASGYDFEQVPEYAPIRHAGHEAGAFFLQPASGVGSG